MQTNITAKQKSVYDFIVGFIANKGRSPALEEIAKHFRKTAPTIHTYIHILIQRGYLKQETGKRGFSISKNNTANTSNRNFNIGIIGYGIVGQAVQYGFSRYNIYIYDKYKNYESLEDVVVKSDYIFICLPTPVKANESGIDLAIMDDNIKKIAKLTNGTDKIIIIKSTIVPGTTGRYSKKYPKTIFAFNPEFLRESSFLQDFINSDRIVVGAKNDQVFRKISSLYQSIMPATPIFYTDPTTAEMVKYMANCYLATKIIFANEMYDICKRLKIKYEEVKKMVTADSRIKDTHLDVTTLRGFGGKCFPKDLLALKHLAKTLKVDTEILDAVWSKNIKLRTVHDWKEIPFAVSDSSFGNKS